MDVIQQIGSYAGFAAVLGVAVMAGLYFSQARDVKRLREWAGRAPDRLTPPAPPSRVVARPVPRPPAAERPAQPAAPPGSQPRPATPAAAGRPAQAATAGATPAAVSQDTMAHPSPAPPASPALAPPLPPPGLGGHFAREAEIARARELAEQQRPEAEGAVEEDQIEDGDLEEGEAGHDELEDEHLEEGEPGDDELEDEEVLEDDEEDGELEEDPGLEDAPPRRPVSPPPPIASRQPLRAPPRRPAQGPILPPYERSRPGGSDPERGPGRSRRTVLAVGGTALLLALATFGVLQLTGGDDAKTTPQDKASQVPEDKPADKGTKAAPKSTIVPADVTVSVLNGTTVGGLAAQLGDKLEGEGFQLGNVTNNTDQQRAESVVLFAPGAEDEAKDVGRRLKIDQREAVDPDSQARAGDASVVVIAGADLNK